MSSFNKPKVFYKGFSTAHYEDTGQNFQLTDIELVKRDLMNHIFTPLGDRLMMPGFGTRIPDLAFEPLDPITLNIVTEDLTTVFNFDPRVSLINLSVNALPNNNAIVAIATLFYIEFDVTSDLNITVPVGS